MANTTEQAHGGTHSLKTTGRRRPYQGPSIDVLGKMTKGFRYLVTVWARLVPDPAFPSAPMSVSLQRDYQGSQTYLNVVPQVPVTASGWTKLSAFFTLADDADGLSLYVETGRGRPVSPDRQHDLSSEGLLLHRRRLVDVRPGPADPDGHSVPEGRSGRASFALAARSTLRRSPTPFTPPSSRST